MISSSQTIGLLFERAAGGRLAAAEGLVLALPQLLPGASCQADLAFDGTRRTLLAVLRIGGDPGVAARARLAFWAARAGGIAVDLDGPERTEETLWRARIERCARRRIGVAGSAVAEALDDLLRRAVVSALDRSGPGRLALRVDLCGPGAAGVAYDAEERRLFVPGALAPPVGDEFDLVVRVRGSARPLSARARVAQVRPPTMSAPGRPAGFVVEMGGLSPELAAAVEATCPRLEGDRGGEARRAAPRYEVRAPVVLERRDGVGELSMVGELVNISLGGAFVRVESMVPPDTALSARILLGGKAVPPIPARVVFATAAGMGLRFEPDQAAEPALLELISRLAARPRRALLVDDDALARSMLGDALERAGFEVLTAAGGRSALEILARELFAVDLIVVDLLMPDLAGAEVVRAVRGAGEQAHIAVVAVSGSIEGEVASHMKWLGADAVLEKSLGPAQIADEANRAVERRREALEAARFAPRPEGPARAASS